MPLVFYLQHYLPILLLHFVLMQKKMMIDMPMMKPAWDLARRFINARGEGARVVNSSAGPLAGVVVERVRSVWLMSRSSGQPHAWVELCVDQI